MCGPFVFFFFFSSSVSCFLRFMFILKRVTFMFLSLTRFLLHSKHKTRKQIQSPWDISTAISPMTGISEKRVKEIVGTSRKSRKIRYHRITKITQNQLSPNQRSQVTKMRLQDILFTAISRWYAGYNSAKSLLQSLHYIREHYTSKDFSIFL